MFEQAIKNKFRWQTSKGLLTVEDLYDLPLQSKVGNPSLDAIAVDLYTELQKTPTISFVTPTGITTDFTQVKFDIVKHIINEKMSTNLATKEAAEKKEKKNKILEILAQRQDQTLASASEDDLKAMLANL